MIQELGVNSSSKVELGVTSHPARCRYMTSLYVADIVLPSLLPQYEV